MKSTKVVSVLNANEKIIVNNLTNRLVKLENEDNIADMDQVAGVYDLLLQCFEKRAMLDNIVR